MGEGGQKVQPSSYKRGINQRNLSSSWRWDRPVAEAPTPTEGFSFLLESKGRQVGARLLFGVTDNAQEHMQLRGWKEKTEGEVKE